MMKGMEQMHEEMRGKMSQMMDMMTEMQGMMNEMMGGDDEEPGITKEDYLNAPEEKRAEMDMAAMNKKNKGM